METLSWILLLINIVLLVILLNKFSNSSKEDEDMQVIEVTYKDGKKENFTNVEDYEFDNFNDFLSINLKGTCIEYIRLDEIKKIHID